MKLNWSLVDDLKNFDISESGAHLAEWKDTKALYLNKSGVAVLLNDDIHFKSYRLQADVAIPEAVGFVGLVFGAKDMNNYELIYLSPGAGDGLGGIQYDPVMNGSTTWQIYNGPDYQASAPYVSGEWVRLEQLAREGFVTEWIVSKPYCDNTQLIETDWTKVDVEENGTLNLNRLYPSAKDISVQARSTVYISEETESVLNFGFSDQLRLWINEEEVYQGIWKWNPPESDGRIRYDFVAVPIRWTIGLNTIRAEITNQEVIFGWGLSLKTGISI